MTTVAVKGRFIAADSQSHRGDMIIGPVKKLHRLKDGSALAITGQYAHLQAWKDYLDGESTPQPSSAGSSVIHLRRDGTCRVYEEGGYFDETGPFNAWGSGHREAYTAMYLRQSALTAVRIAAEFDPWTGGEIEQMYVDPPDKQTLPRKTKVKAKVRRGRK